MSDEKSKQLKLTDELERHEDFWQNKKDDSHGINLSVSIAINAIRQAVLSAIVEDDEGNSDERLIDELHSDAHVMLRKSWEAWLRYSGCKEKNCSVDEYRRWILRSHDAVHRGGEFAKRAQDFHAGFVSENRESTRKF